MKFRVDGPPPPFITKISFCLIPLPFFKKNHVQLDPPFKFCYIILTPYPNVRHNIFTFDVIRHMMPFMYIHLLSDLSYSKYIALLFGFLRPSYSRYSYKFGFLLCFCKQAICFPCPLPSVTQNVLSPNMQPGVEEIQFTLNSCAAQNTKQNSYVSTTFNNSQ